ncbi:MAG: hypothetical protein II937_03535 [Bacteroidales bacterium]|jgi:hypothetical protein|nr:hypothetical protein [Bacteroidales bacterium]MBQ5402818.1 hypothetical protein [Bacteroidales bacterium]MBR6278580.1 hypothetical protein [Bacteroidales bacterium]
MKKIFTILSVMLLLSINCMAQSEEEEAQLFGLTRSTGNDISVNFGKIGTQVVEKVVVIDNKENATMKITGFILPTGVAAMSLQKSIEDFGKGKVKIIIDPAYAGNVKDEQITVNVSFFDRNGNQKKNSQLTYKIQAD